ncbi:MAG TPA: hypothetical protein VGM01_06975, partial [Ktedonobacteraceae bacterium]
MKNQDLAQSTANMAHTPSPGFDEGARWPGSMNTAQPSGTQQTPAQVVGAPREPRNTPPGSGDTVPSETRNASYFPTASSNDAPPPFTFKLLRDLTPFWHDRLIEVGLILSMGLYYLVGNPTFGAGNFLHLPPYLYSFPFLAIFAFLSWYRLSFAVALLPLALPYYIYQKTIFSHGTHHYDFSLIEI